MCSENDVCVYTYINMYMYMYFYVYVYMYIKLIIGGLVFIIIISYCCQIQLEFCKKFTLICAMLLNVNISYDMLVFLKNLFF